MELLKILLVDDDLTVLRIVSGMLADLGFAQIRVAPSPQEGVKVARAFRPDVILSDIEMGETSGFDFVTELRSVNSDMLRVPVIFLTGHADPGFVAKAKEMRVSGYLLKPVDPAKLKASLQRVYTNLLALGQLKNAPGRLI